MLTSLFTLAVFLNVPLGSHSNSGVPLPIESLEGTWGPVTYLNQVMRTKRPQESANVGAPFTFEIHRNGKVWELLQGNFHEGIGGTITGVTSKGKDRFTLLLERGVFEIGLVHRKDGTLRIRGTYWGYPTETYRRLEGSFSDELNRIVLAGKYKDPQGLVYEFSKSVATWPGIKPFEYQIEPDSTESGCEYFKSPNTKEGGDYKRYGYRWTNGRLFLYTIEYDGPNFPIACVDKPFVILTPLR